MPTYTWAVGQDVAVLTRYASLRELAKVERVSPTGRATVHGLTFNPDGRCRGGSYSAPSIRPATDADHRAILRRSVWGRIRVIVDQEWAPGHLTDDDLQKILDTLRAPPSRAQD